MQTYAEVLTYAIPFFFILILIEFGVSRWMKKEVYRSFDTISSLSSGMTNSIKEVLGLAVIIISYSWLVEHLAIIEIESTVLIYVLTFVGLDFVGYWVHRFEHEINLFWNRHIIHHSSEEFNLACALRQNVSAIVSIFFFLFIPLALIGIPAEVIAVVAPLHLFAQFWYHTRLIDRMGPLEYILVTPSHHRVHHAINDIYLDKNFSQVFIIWDKLFGTFQEEVESESAVYGVKRQSLTWNPILINFQHMWVMVKDAWYTKSFKDKLRVFYMPTGWRPEDRVEAAPIPYTEDAHSQIKYDVDASYSMHVWSWMQLLIHNVLILHMFSVLADFPFVYIVLYGLFLVVSIFGYTSLMDLSRWSMYAEGLKIALFVIIAYSLGSWYGVENSKNIITFLMAGYVLLSAGMTLYFHSKEVKSFK